MSLIENRRDAARPAVQAVVKVLIACLVSGLLLIAVSGLVKAVTPQSAWNKSAEILSYGVAPRDRSSLLGSSEVLTYQIYLPLLVRNYPRVSPIGIQMYGALNTSNGFTRVVESGANWVRFQAIWSKIEPVNTTPDQYSWSGLDASLQAAHAADVQIVLTIDGNPTWAAPTSGGPVTNLADLVEFANAVAARYPYVQYIELYNEPDSIFRYGFKADQYAAMLKAVYPAVKAANSSAQVVLGGLAMDWFTDGGGPFDRDFLRNVLINCGTSQCFDVANFHYYPSFRSGWEPYGRDIIGKANYVRQVLESYHFSRPIICTETDWPAGLTWGSPESAARYVPKVYVRGMAASLPIVAWFALTDASSGGPGLLDSSSNPGTLIPRPAFYALSTLTHLMAGAAYVRTITQTNPISDRIEGYQFTTAGGKRLDVYWYDCPSMVSNSPPQDCDGVAPLKIEASRIAKIDKFGNQTIVLDEDDGYRDGLITLGVLSSPIYIDYAP